MRKNVTYFDWLCTKVFDQRYSSLRYSKLFNKLYNTHFIYILNEDKNRQDDGVALRFQFSHETANTVDDREPANVLEVLVALAMRCENEIMGNDDFGNRTGIWFWEMLNNIGIGHMNDREYNEETIDILLYKFLHREYDNNGIGCAFRTTKDVDMRNTELWYQMQYHINECC